MDDRMALNQLYVDWAESDEDDSLIETILSSEWLAEHDREVAGQALVSVLARLYEERANANRKGTYAAGQRVVIDRLLATVEQASTDTRPGGDDA